jgi:hypothetical protein
MYITVNLQASNHRRLRVIGRIERAALKTRTEARLIAADHIRRLFAMEPSLDHQIGLAQARRGQYNSPQEV